MHDFSTANTLFYRYLGKSMWPFFQTGDILVVKRVLPDELRPGDCVVYRRTGQEKAIAHRIVQTRPDIRTRGDARPLPDDEAIVSYWVVGRVDERIRHGWSKRVPGGNAGILVGQFHRYMGKLDPSRDTRGGKIARLIRRVFKRLSFCLFHHARLISFQGTGDRQLYRLIIGESIVMGTYDGIMGAWSLTWPYSIVIDPVHLPKPNSIEI